MDIQPSISANYGNEYNDALMNLVGTITEGDAVYNYTKSGQHAALWARR